MALVIDKRDKVKTGPGLHVLIAGISAYPHLLDGDAPSTTNSLGMGQISFAAMTAYKIYRWILDRQSHFTAPLVTCRVMLAPSRAEMEAEPELKRLAGSCNVQEFLGAATDWKSDAAANRNSVTIFYFVGHGLLLNQSAPVMLFQDFGDGIGPSLRSAVAVDNLYYGLAPTTSQPDIGRTQLYFIDSSRIEFNEFRTFQTANTTPVFDAERPGIDDRSAAIFYAASPGDAAYGFARGQSLFSTALLKCLNGAAATLEETDEEGHARWCVSTSSLINGLQKVFAEISQEFGVAQQFAVSGQVRDSIIAYLETAPIVELTIELDPIDALPFARFSIRDQNDKTVLETRGGLGPTPLSLKLAAGVYNIAVDFDSARGDFIPVRRTRAVMPPRTVVRMKVLP